MANTPQDVRRRARELLAVGLAADPFVQRSGTIAEPIPVRAPDGSFHAWFVPITLGTRLLGFFELGPDLVYRRYSGFAHAPGSAEGCPSAASWIDPDVVRRAAAARLRPGETLGTAYLTYDRTPARMAWCVEAAAAGSPPRRIFVAGETAYDGPESGHGEPTFG